MVTPTGYTALDLVGFTDRGAYSSSANYVKNDLAHYAGSIWRCLIDDTTNIVPAEGVNWTVFVAEPSNLVEASIAPIETSPAMAAHAQGTQLFYNDTLYKAKTAIAIGDTLTVGTNIEAADKVTVQISSKANSADLATVATSGAYSDLSGTPSLATVATSGSYSDLNNKPTLGTAAAKDSTNAVTQSSTDLVESGAVYTEIDSLNEALTNEVATRVANGAHNLLPNNAKTQVINGVTFTVNSDGSVTANVPANPNAVTLSLTTTLKLPAGTYKLTGCPSGGSTTRYYMQGVGNVDYTTGSAILDTGEGFTFTLTATNTLLFNILIRTGFTEGGTITFYPMIRLASDPDTTYRPYAMTNRRLTERMSVGYMKVSLTANTTKTVSSDIDLVEGAKPVRPAFSWFTCVNFSANVDANVTINVDSGNIYIRSTATHTVGIRWLQFDPYI